MNRINLTCTASSLRSRSQGFSLIEVLITLLIMVIGIVGMFGLMSRASVAEMESYQRAQALTLVKDMEARIRVNRVQFDATFQSNYASSTAPAVLGTGSTVDCSGTPTGALGEICQWNTALLGAAESATVGGSTTSVGAMNGARGCIIAMPSPTGGAVAEWFVVVVWQGMRPSADPLAGSPAAVCASNVNFGTGQRRAVTSRVLVPLLG